MAWYNTASCWSIRAAHIVRAKAFCLLVVRVSALNA